MLNRRQLFKLRNEVVSFLLERNICYKEISTLTGIPIGKISTIITYNNWQLLTYPRMDSRYVREIFVFGSNDQGRHGMGAALHARRSCGATYGQARGLQGDSYAIVTKVLRLGKRSVPLEKIEEEVDLFIRFAREHYDWKFTVVEIGCKLAGYTPDEIAPMFKRAPSNVYLPDSFLQVLTRFDNDRCEDGHYPCIPFHP